MAYETNKIFGFPRWTYGIRIRSSDNTVTFDVERDDGKVLCELHASAGKVTADGFGYEQVAQAAIRAYEREVSRQGEDQ